MGFSEALVGDFEAEVRATRATLEAIPEDRFDWKPDEKSMTAAQLAGHIAENASWVAGMMEGELDFASMMEGYAPYVPESRDDLLATFDKHAAAYTEMLGGRDDAFMSATWTMKNGDQVLMEQPRHAAIRMIGIHHMIHHRGQLGVYLRLLGAPVPPTYGPTADYPEAMGA